MNGALLELLWRGWRGALVQRARRLRQPRYLVAALLSAAYFAFLVLPSYLRGLRAAGRPAPAAFPGAASAEAALLASFAGSLALAWITTLIWIFSSAKPALSLGEADIALLLPAPLPRRKIVELSLWRQQAGLLFGALVITLLRGSGPPGTRLLRLAVTWALLTLASLHPKGVSLWKAGLSELPRAAAGRRIAAAIAAGAAFWAVLAATLGRPLAAALRAAAGGPAFDVQGVRAALHHAAAAPPLPAALLLAPFRWLAAAVLSRGTGLPGGGWQTAAPWQTAAILLFLAALVWAHYEWVVRSRARFEEATIERARRQAERRRRQPTLPAPAAAARRRQPFRLAPTGPPEAAIYWKNLVSGWRTPLSRRLALALLPGPLSWAVLTATGAPLGGLLSAGSCGLLAMLILPVFGALGQPRGLRSDLLRFEVLRPWPLPGWRLVAAELMAPATTLLLALAAGWSTLLGTALAAGPRLADLRGAYGAPALAARSPLAWIVALSAALFLGGTAVLLLALAAQNVAVLALPAWMPLDGERRTGSALAGARMLMMLGLLLVVLAGLLPALLVSGAAVLAGAWIGLAPAPWQAPLLALLACLPLLAETALLVRLGGAMWDRLDPSEDLATPPP